MPLQSASRRVIAELVETSKTATTSAWVAGSLAAIAGLVSATVTDRMVRLREAQLADELSDRVAN